MALYHLSARIIGRKQGRSSVQVAAYQARDKIYDEYNDQRYDFRKKGGLLHAEILAPENTPDWMLERAQLWNGLEKAEKRKDSQLCRWFDIALPDELNHEQRVDLLRTFALEQWVSKGLIADIAVHAPTRDEKNHHAHVLIAMRSVTSEGFGPKAFRGDHAERAKVLEAERAAWADHQNRTFERLGLDVRVDHRSNADRGIDQQPTKHMGAEATQMMDKAEPSRIAEQNREIEEANQRRLDDYVELANAYEPPAPPPSRSYKRRPPIRPIFNHAASMPLTRIDREWAQRDHERIVELERRERLALLDLDRKHQPRRIELEADQARRNGTMKATLQAGIEQIDRRAEAKGLRRFFRKITGGIGRDEHRKEMFVKTLDGIAQREKEERDAQEARFRMETLRTMDTYKKLRIKLQYKLAMDHDSRQRGLGRMDEDRTRKGTPPERIGAPPKREPHLQPAPPRGAREMTYGQSSAKEKAAAFDARVKAWAATPEGERVWREGDAAPKRPRADWHQPSKEAQPAPEKSKRRDDWYDAASPQPEPTKGKDKERDR